MKYTEICNKYYVNFPELKFQIKNEGFRGENNDEFTDDMLEFLSGDLDDCELSDKDRKNGVNIEDLVRE